MTTAESIRSLLSSLEPVRLEIWNESDQHAGPPGRESHFKILIVSDRFQGQSRLDRNRTVNSLLQPLMMAQRGSIHAVSLRLITSEEVQKGGALGFESPPCQGS